MKKQATTAILFHGIETVSGWLVVFYVYHSGQYGILFIWPSCIRQLFESLLFSQRCYKYALEAHTHSKTDIISGITRDLIAFPLRGLPSPNLPGKGDADDQEDNTQNREEPAQPPPRYPRYTEQCTRLQSFRNWPHPQPTPEVLSAAGFFYTGIHDSVRCFHCGIGLRGFSQEVDPLQEHAKHSPNCHFLRKLLGGNVSSARLVRSDFMPLYNHREKTSRKQSREYRHPEYISPDARLATFTTWPSNLTQTPEQLANAGFYYTGFEDQVRCFACDGGLRRWDGGDIPWIEHCRWFPSCPYAIETHGSTFIAMIQASAEAELTIDRTTKATMLEHKIKCLSIGYEEQDFEETVKELKNRGKSVPSFDDILDLIDIIKNETPLDKNRRLRSYVICMQCQKNDINALLLPCGHLKVCMTCATPLQRCPVCGRTIRDKIKTYMG